MSNRLLKPAKPKAPSRAAIAYLHPGQTSAMFTNSLVGMLLYDRAHEQRIGAIFNEWSSANVSQARNSVVRQFLASPCEWLLFIDSDMEFGPDALDKLLAAADPVAAPIVGGLCFGANNGLLWPTIYKFIELDDGRPMTTRVAEYPRDAMVQVDATGAAFLLIHRDAAEKIEAQGFSPVFPWFQETEMSGAPVGEDLTFCIRARLAGLPVWVNTAVKIGHHKSHLLTEALFDAQRSEETA